MQQVYQKRRAALQRVMAEQGVAAAVINNPSNAYYYCGVMYHTMERLMALLIPAAGEQCYIVLPEMEKGRLHDAAIEELGYLDGQDNIALLSDRIKPGAKVGVEKSYLNHGRAEALAQKCGCGFAGLVDLSGVIERQRLYKDELEIELLQKAAAMTDQMLAAWKSCVKVGAKESEMMFELIRLMAVTEDAEWSFGAQISSGPNTSIAHGIVGERTVQPGEQVLIDFGVMYKYYHADITRTLFPSEPTAKLREIYEVVLAANKAGIAAVKPGVPIKEVDAAARRVIEEAGYGEYFTHRTGHGIGLDIHEFPDARGDNEMLLEPGMTFTVEPGIYLPNWGGARVEDDVLVTENGVRVLTNYPKELAQVML